MPESFSVASENLEGPRSVREILADLRHPGNRKGKTHMLFDELTKAINRENSPSDQPPLQLGFARLYRGEPVIGDFPRERPAVKIHALADQYGESGGRWFDLIEEEARRYAGENGTVYFVDVPASSLATYEAINFGVGLPGEFIIPETLFCEKRILPKPE